MSEYQYYGFRAIDRPLTDRQMRELRAISTRAAISRTSFSNHYEFGDLKANPRDLLVKYFDASLYFANWLYLEIAFRYSRDVVAVKALRRYASGHTLDIRTTARDVVVAISVESDGESFDTADDGSGWLSSLLGLRADIAGGDERPLYLAWLFDVQCGVIDDDAIESAPPGGLATLSPALESLADIIGLDRDLLAMAAERAPRAARHRRFGTWERWLKRLDTAEHVALLARVARGDGSVSAELMRRFRRHAPRPATRLPPRTASELRAGAEAIATKRRQVAREREDRQRAQRQREERAARQRYLTDLANREHQTWQRVDALVDTKRPRDYDGAVQLLSDLFRHSSACPAASPDFFLPRCAEGEDVAFGIDRVGAAPRALEKRQSHRGHSLEGRVDIANDEGELDTPLLARPRRRVDVDGRCDCWRNGVQRESRTVALELHPIVQARVLDGLELQDVAIERRYPIEILHEQHRSVELHRYFLFSSCANTVLT